MNQRLKYKRALVTGGSRGIGAAIVTRCTERRRGVAVAEITGLRISRRHSIHRRLQWPDYQAVFAIDDGRSALSR